MRGISIKSKGNTKYRVHLWICRLHRKFENEVIDAVFSQTEFTRMKRIFCGDLSLSKVVAPADDSKLTESEDYSTDLQKNKLKRKLYTLSYTRLLNVI